MLEKPSGGVRDRGTLQYPVAQSSALKYPAVRASDAIPVGRAGVEWAWKVPSQQVEPGDWVLVQVGKAGAACAVAR